MSTRGVRFNFSPGEIVLCFEPDPTKARVIYEAKILDTTVYKDFDGKRQPGYHIHFLRWNNSWDRIVGEPFVLKDIDQNRDLMKQLTEVARKVRKNRTRKKKIREILAHAYNGELPEHLENSNEDSNGDDDDDGDDENTTDTDDGSGSAVESSNGDSSSTSVNGKDEENRRSIQDVDIELPDALRIVLEKDFFSITNDRQLIMLPSDVSAITVLESFVKTFTLDFWSSSFDRTHFCSTAPKIALDRVLPVLKEFVDGLRICFDFALPLILLYDEERTQYDKIINTYKHKSPLKSKEPVTEDSPLIQSPRSRSRQSHIDQDEPSPKLPKLSPNILDENDEEKEITFITHEEPTPRRVTRLSAHEKKAEKPSTSQTGSSSVKPDKSEKIEKHKTSRNEEKEKHTGPSTRTRRSLGLQNDPPKRELRNTRKSSACSNGSELSKSDSRVSDMPKVVIEKDEKIDKLERDRGDKVDKTDRKSDKDVSDKADKSERPPPLLIPCNISTRQQNGVDKVPEKATGSTDSGGESGREEILENILSWRMLPPEIEAKLPTPPSLLYGPQHLLRMFVKLPEVLSRMDMEDNKLGVLLKLTSHFLIYLSEHLAELFPEKIYVPASEA